MNPNGYANDEPFPPSKLDDATQGKATKVVGESSVVTNGLNGVNGAH